MASWSCPNSGPEQPAAQLARGVVTPVKPSRLRQIEEHPYVGGPRDRLANLHDDPVNVPDERKGDHRRRRLRYSRLHETPCHPLRGIPMLDGDTPRGQHSGHQPLSIPQATGRCGQLQCCSAPAPIAAKHARALMSIHRRNGHHVRLSFRFLTAFCREAGDGDPEAFIGAQARGRRRKGQSPLGGRPATAEPSGEGALRGHARRSCGDPAGRQEKTVRGGGRRGLGRVADLLPQPDQTHE
jgi:hypothetical protein